MTAANRLRLLEILGPQIGLYEFSDEIDRRVSLGTGSSAVVLAEPSARAPLPTDDVNAGYVAGQFWTIPGATWQCLRNNAGSAIWTPFFVGTGPADLVPVASGGAAFGMKRLTAAYGTGACIDVQLGSGGSATTINFLPNGELDIAALETVLKGATGRISKWYDQSGNANHATQSTFLAMPGIAVSNQIGGARSVVFDAGIDTSGPNVCMVLPAGVATTSVAVSIAAVTRVNSSARNAPFVQLTNASFPYSYGVYFQSRVVQVYFGGNRPSAQSGPTTPFVSMVASSGSANVHTVGGVESTTSGNVSQPLAGGFLGYSVSFSGYGNFEAAAILIYPSTVSQANQDLLQSSLNTLFNIPSQTRNVVVFDGDSITQGFQASLHQGYPRKLIPLLKHPATVYNLAYYGQTLANRVSLYPNEIAPLFNPAAKNNILSIWAATNDFYISGSLAPAVYASYQQYVALAQATGFKVIVATVTPRSGGTNAQVAPFNALVQAGWNLPQSAGGLGADAFVDIASDPTMGVFSSTYYADTTHPDDLGYSVTTPLFATAVNGLMV